MSFLPTLRPGNIRPTLNLNTDFFGTNTDTFVYERDSRFIALNKTNPCSGNSEIVAGIMRVYEPFDFATPDPSGQSTIASSQLGHDSRLELDIQVTNGSDNNFRIHYDDSPSEVFHTLAEGQHNKVYNYFDMRPETQREDDRGVYRQAAFRIVHSSANEGNENACFNQLDFNDPSTVDNIYSASDHDPVGCSGNGITDLHIKLTDKSSGTQTCNIGVGDSHALKNCEQLDIQNTANRRARSGLDNNSSSGGQEFYRDMKALIDPGDAPYFDVGASRANTFRRCHALLELNDTWEDPDRKVVPANCSSLALHFFQCFNLRRIPNKYFTSGLDSPNAKLESCDTFQETFLQCYSLTHIPKVPMREYDASRDYKGGEGTRVARCFYYCHNLEAPPEGFHLRDLRIGDTNAHSNAAYAGISQLFTQCYSLKQLGDFRFDDIPLYNENSPAHRFRIPAHQCFVNAAQRLHKFPYVGSFGIIGANLNDGGPTTANDAEQMLRGINCQFDSPYNKEGITIGNMSEVYYLFYITYGGPKHLKLRCIADNPVSKDLTKAVPDGTSVAQNNNFYRMFYQNDSLERVEFVGMHHWIDEFQNNSNTEYAGMFQNNYNLREVKGWVGNKANDSGDYSSMFSNAKIVQRFHCGGEKVGTFDGSNDYIDTGLPSSTLRPASADTSYTLSAVADIDTISSSQGLGRLITAADGGSTRGGIEINSESGTARAIFRIGGTRYDSDGDGGATAVTITTGTKFHVCATVDFTGTDTANMKLYVDGVLSAQHDGISMGGAAGSTSVKVGSNGDGSTHFFDGKMYDVRIYNDVLTAAEVSALSDELLYLKYNSTAEDAEKNMILHYDFEDGFGGTDKYITTISNKAGQSKMGGSYAQYNGTINGATSAQFWANFDQFGPKYSFSMTECPLTPAALREIFVNLPTVSSGTFTNTSNASYTDLLTANDKAIATDKGWTLSFS